MLEVYSKDLGIIRHEIDIVTGEVISPILESGYVKEKNTELFCTRYSADYKGIPIEIRLFKTRLVLISREKTALTDFEKELNILDFEYSGYK